jgi:hypothetical protein
MKNNVLQKGGTLAIAALGADRVTKSVISQLAKKYQITIALQSTDFRGLDFYFSTGAVRTDENQTFGIPGTRGGCGPGLQPSGRI